MPGGIEVKSINKRAELAGGAPLYDFVGLDKATGKPVEQPITENMLQTFVRSISDPKAQQAMVAQQAKLLYEAEQKRRDKLLDSDLRMKEEHAKPRLVGRTRPSIPRMVPAACVWRPRAARPPSRSRLRRTRILPAT